MTKIIILLASIAILITSCTKKESHRRGEAVTRPKAVNSSTTNLRKGEVATRHQEKKHKLDAKSIKEEFYEVIFNFKDELPATEDFLFTVNAIPRKDKHINTSFPLSISFEDSCFKFDKKKYKNKDTKKLDKKNLVFELKSKCETKGKQELKGNLKFGYCDDNLCYTYNSPFKFNINIK